MNDKSANPYLVAINLTQRCNLNCAHCYMDAEQRREAGTDELTLAEITELLTTIGDQAPRTIAVLTGGEPLLRRDLDQIVAAGVAAGLEVVLGTNGIALTQQHIRHFRELGLAGVGISLDAANAADHDQFRGSAGSFDRSCQAVRRCAENGLHAQVHFTVTRQNQNTLDAAVELARDLGAGIINFFFLVCVGRGQSLLDLTPTQYEQALQHIARLQREQKGIMVQARCAPHFKRVLYEQDPASLYTRATGYDGGGCPAATHYCRVTPSGDVTPCPYMENSAGNVRDEDFWTIWQTSALMNALRQPQLQGKCAACQYTKICGGCRARALAVNGDLLGADPSCSYLPGGETVIPVVCPADQAPDAITWSDEARDRLKNIPIFLRRRVKQRLEEHAATAGATVISAELMQEYREQREQEMGICFGQQERRTPDARSV